MSDNKGHIPAQTVRAKRTFTEGGSRLRFAVLAGAVSLPYFAVLAWYDWEVWRYGPLTAFAFASTCVLTAAVGAVVGAQVQNLRHDGERRLWANTLASQAEESGARVFVYKRVLANHGLLMEAEAEVAGAVTNDPATWRPSLARQEGGRHGA